MLSNEPNVAAAFIGHAETNSDRLFVRICHSSGHTDYSFKQIRNLAYAYNAHFRSAGLQVGSVVAIILTHSVEIYAAFLGSMMAGLVPTIMPFPTPKQDREKYWRSHGELFALSGIKAVFSYAENVDDIQRHLGEQVHHISIEADVDLNEFSSEITFGDLAVLQHSSGTTSLKKGVMLTHRAIFNQVANYTHAIGMNAQSRIVSWLPLYHDMGFIACFLTPMIVGCALSHLDAFTWSAKPTVLLDEIVAFGGEYIWLPNFAYNHIANSMRKSKEWDLGTVKAIINCSEPCKSETFEVFRSKPQLRNLSPAALQVCYAMAENVFAVSQTPIGEPPKKITVTTSTFREGMTVELAPPATAGVDILSCGRIIHGTEVAILRPNGTRSYEEKVIGEIAISGSSLYSGYYRRPEITEKRLVDGWHHTGDIGFVINDELYVTGRVDDLLIIRGKNIYAHEIEEAVNALGLTIPGRAVAFSVFSQDRGEVSLVVLAESEDVSTQSEIRKAVRKTIEEMFGVSLADFRILAPRTLRKTTSGKLSRKDNVELFLELQG
jgi:acyl-CoA synthetase (AMP-forming)/AMP-acid ligase II